MSNPHELYKLAERFQEVTGRRVVPECLCANEYDGGEVDLYVTDSRCREAYSDEAAYAILSWALQEAMVAELCNRSLDFWLEEGGWSITWPLADSEYIADNDDLPTAVAKYLDWVEEKKT